MEGLSEEGRTLEAGTATSRGATASITMHAADEAALTTTMQGRTIRLLSETVSSASIGKRSTGTLAN